MRLLHFHNLSQNCFLAKILLSDPFAINDKSPNEGNAKNDQQKPVDPVNNMNIMRSKAVADLSRQENFQYVRSEHP